MLETQFSISWEQHMYNISYGLNKFRQNGEFVDMTLAADGYFLKVHQMILSLVSPYIKDIITSLQCTHPVIFLNNVSYNTLCSILDYVYNGEVQVSKEQLDDLIKAGKSLQIKGLQEMNSQPMTSNLPLDPIDQSRTNISKKSPEDKNDVLPTKSETLVELGEKSSVIQCLARNEAINNQNIVENAEHDQNHEMQSQCCDGTVKEPGSIDCTDVQNSFIINQDCNDYPTPFFTLSNQGSLQLLLNRHLYFLKYKSTSASGHSQWKCVNYINTKCPAYVITKNDKVIQKHIRHEHHPYHDMKIAKKIASGEMFSSMTNAEEFAKSKKASKLKKNRMK